MKNGRYQCKDIPREPILRFLANVPGDDFGPRSACSYGFWDGGYLPTNSVAHGFPLGTPRKLGLRVMGKLIKSGLVDGCACGCRGNFELTPAGCIHLRILGVMAKPSPWQELLAKRTLPSNLGTSHFIIPGTFTATRQPA